MMKLDSKLCSPVPHFEYLIAPRAVNARKHFLTDVTVISVCAILCGMVGPTAIPRGAVAWFDWLKQFLSLPNGTESRDCIRQFLMAVNPEDFRNASRRGFGRH